MTRILQHRENRGEIMTLDEVIVHEKELAKEIYIEAMLCHANPDDGKLDDCIERGKYHEQIAEWLEELKSYRVSVFSGNMTQIMLKEEYNKAIDDFVREFKRKTPMENCLIDELAKQLKAGEQNEQR